MASVVCIWSTCVYVPPSHHHQWWQDPPGTPSGRACRGPDAGRKEASAVVQRLQRGGPAASPQHLLCCGRRWPSPGASRCRPSGPFAASEGSAGSAGSAGTWPGRCPGFPRQPPAQMRSARRCLERGWRVGKRGKKVRPGRGSRHGTVGHRRAVAVLNPDTRGIRVLLRRVRKREL